MFFLCLLLHFILNGTACRKIAIIDCSILTSAINDLSFAKHSGIGDKFNIRPYYFCAVLFQTNDH